MIGHDSAGSPASNSRTIEIISLITRHFGKIFVMALIGTGLGYLYFTRTPPVYQSSISVHIRSDFNGKNNPLQGSESTHPGSRDEPHTALLTSPFIVEKALVAPLEADKEKSSRVCDLPCFANLPKPSGAVIRGLNARNAQQNGVENRDIVNLTYRNSDPLAAKLVLEALVDSYREYLAESHKNVGQDLLRLIDDARLKLLETAKRTEDAYAMFRADTPLMFHEDDKAINVHKSRMSEIELARRNMRILITDKKAALQSILQALETGGSREAISLMLLTMKPDARLSDAGLKSPAQEIFALQLELELAMQDLGTDHPKVKNIQKRLDMTQKFLLSQVDDEGGKQQIKKGDFLSVCLDALRYEVQSLESRAIELDELFESERYNAKSIAAYELKNQQYLKEIERTETLYQRVLKQLDELNLLQDYGGYKMSIISPANVGYQVAPNFLQCLLVGALAGAALGLALAYLSESNDKTFRTPEEISQQLGVPIVGHVPVIHGGPSTYNRTQTSLDPSLVAVFKPKSQTSEAYRAIRTALYFSSRGEGHRIIQVTSPNPGDGKTTLCCNLAVSIAQSGKRVLLIDADFRRPRVHKVLGISKDVGMSSVIAGTVELPDAIQTTEVENLWGLVCGPHPNNPCELLTSRRFEELLEILRDRFDFVLIDTPPVMAVTDPAAVAPRVDGVFVTITLNKRTRFDATKTIEILSSVGANMLGVIVNRIGTSKKSNYMGYSGYGEYRYSSRSKASYGYDYSYDYSDADNG